MTIVLKFVKVKLMRKFLPTSTGSIPSTSFDKTQDRSLRASILTTSTLSVNNKKGFTLIELLVVLTIITILAVAVSVALNPAQRLNDAQDARRAADVDSILTAIHESIIDNKGTFPSNLPTTETLLGTDATGCNISTGDCTLTPTACVNMMTGGQNLTNYLASMPIDPDATVGSAGKTGYSAVRSSTTGIVTVKACYTDGTNTIQASR